MLFDSKLKQHLIWLGENILTQNIVQVTYNKEIAGLTIAERDCRAAARSALAFSSSRTT
jgi:hypothetical protein